MKPLLLAFLLALAAPVARAHELGKVQVYAPEVEAAVWQWLEKDATSPPFSLAEAVVHGSVPRRPACDGRPVPWPRSQ